MHILCTICSDLLNQADNIYVTKCGHVFHYLCLVQWIVRSKTCPQCRNKVTEKCMFRVYPTISNENTDEDVTTLQSRLDDAQLELRAHKASVKEKEDKLTNAELNLKKNLEVLKATQKKLDSKEAAVTALKEQLEYIKIQNKETQKLKEENNNLNKNLQTLTGLQKVLNATTADVEQMLESYSDLRTIATFASALKRALSESESKKNKSRDRLQLLKQKLSVEKASVVELQGKVVQLENKVGTIQRKYKCLLNKRKASEASLDQSIDSVESAKQMKSSDAEMDSIIAVDKYDSPVPAKEYLYNAIPNGNNESNTSVTAMVDKIEQADSPYLNLRCSGLQLATLFRGPSQTLTSRKPSQVAVQNPAKGALSTKKVERNFNYTIFGPKQPPVETVAQENDKTLSEMNISYDGFGGHSKLDTFPVPKSRPAKRSYVPKVTNKHRLKRPTQSGSQDIGKFMEIL